MDIINHIFILNPAAGKGSESKPLCEKIKDACTVACKSYEIYYTKERGDATRFVSDRIKNKSDDEILRFYACGGDGTLSEVVSGAVGHAHGIEGAVSGVEVGCIPIGTGNDFVRNFENVQFFSDMTKQILADTYPIDCFYCQNGLYGINMINIGFDCEVAAKTSEYKKKPFMPKRLAYIAGLAVEFKGNRGKVITVIDSEGNVTKKEFQLASAANGGFCGGGFYSAPRSSLTDGLLDISLIDKVTRRTFLGLVGAYKKGTHLETETGKRIVHYTQAKSVRFEFDEPTNVCIDGEIVRMEALSLSVLKNAVNFVVPVGCRIKH